MYLHSLKGVLITLSDSFYTVNIFMQTLHSSVVSDHHFLTEDYTVFKIAAKEYKAPALLREGIPNVVTKGEDLGCQHHTYQLKMSLF